MQSEILPSPLVQDRPENFGVTRNKARLEAEARTAY